MPCPLCEQFYREFPLVPDEHEPGRLVHVLEPGCVSEPIQCAFDGAGVFTTDNWGCETTNALREMLGEGQDDPVPYSAHLRDDMRKATLGVLPIPESHDEGVQQVYVVLSYYKRRGRVGRAYVFWDDHEPAPLLLATAQLILTQGRQGGV